MATSLSSDLSCQVTSTGITAPTYDQIYAALVGMYQSIYGSDVVLDNSTQDGQLLGIFAEAINQVNAATIMVYNSFSPEFAIGNGLSSVVKINGITRKPSSYSTVDLLITGTPGTILTNASARDGNNYVWNIPSGTTISSSGTVLVTATCTTIGSVTALPASVTTINTPILGWSAVTNPTESSPGSPVESDATLRQRQAQSCMLPNRTSLDGIIGGILSLPGVVSCTGFENDTDTAAANGVPAHSIALVVDGGDALEIATVIANKKGLGVATAGNTTESVTTEAGNVVSINFYRPTSVTVNVVVSLDALTGYTDTIGSAISEAVSAYISSVPSGSTIYLTRLFKPATLDDTAGGSTYDIVSIQMSRDSGSAGTDNIVLAFNELPVCAPSNVTVSAS